MKILTKEELADHFSQPHFLALQSTADRLGMECYVVGGYVRDLMLERPSTDIDVVVVGSGVAFAQAVALDLGLRQHLSVYRNFGTAQLRMMGHEIEFVGARRESYDRGSRKPVVEDGTLEDDQNRRDFTINAMAVCLNRARLGELVDPFDGVLDLRDRIIATPLDPEVTFSDDPLRMMRCVRFASQLGFVIEQETFQALEKMRNRLSIISQERIIEELNKIIMSSQPSYGLGLLLDSGLMELVLPEVFSLHGVETRQGRAHKDNLLHTLEVLDNVARDGGELYLRWAALLHDVGKPVSKRFDARLGWTFHNHAFIGSRMVPQIFRRLKLPLGEPMRYVQKLVSLHMRPIAIADDEVTDSAVRRLMFEAGDDLDALIRLCTADITSKNHERKERFRQNYRKVLEKIEDLRLRDSHRTYQPPVTGNIIMKVFQLPPCDIVGRIKGQIKEAIWNSEIPDDYASAYRMMLDVAREQFSLEPRCEVTFEQAQMMDGKSPNGDEVQA